MRIAVDRAVLGIAETFGRIGEVILLEGREMTGAQLREVDALVVRSVTPVGPSLLAGTSVRFVGTTTIGTDHLDLEWLDAKGIEWASAPGCNADAAAQYTLAMMLLACERLARNFFLARVGIIGRGNVGTRLQALLDALGVAHRACDPPLAEIGVEGLASREDALDSSIVCLHVPLSFSGRHATYRSIDAAALRALPDGALLVNTARGEVIETTALMAALASGRLRVSLDVWPNEPDIERELAARSVVATPHVAGYSLDGRFNGTRMIFRALCSWAGIPCDERCPVAPPGPCVVAGEGREGLVRSIIRHCQVEADDWSLRNLTTQTDSGIGPGFDRLRRDYPLRRDFGACTAPSGQEHESVLRRLGFRAGNAADERG